MRCVVLALVVLTGCVPTASHVGRLRELGYHVRGPLGDGWIRVEDPGYRIELPGVPEVTREDLGGGETFTGLLVRAEADSMHVRAMIWDRARARIGGGVARPR